ncbi:MAG TPA: hypothetical protein VF783_14095 [Terriglobales bacterium]
MAKQYYTYIHCKPDGAPFYVGKGREYRALLSGKRNIHHQRIVAKYGEENIGIFIFPCESEERALADEMQQIAQLRKEGYELANMTDGGEGHSGLKWTEERRKRALGRPTWNKGRPFSEETRLKMAGAQKGNSKAKGHKMTQANRDKLYSPEMWAQRARTRQLKKQAQAIAEGQQALQLDEVSGV